MIHLFDSPWGAEHAYRALCGALRDVSAPVCAVVAPWAHPETRRRCVAVVAEGPHRQERVVLRARAADVVYPAAVIDLAARRRT